MIKETPVDTVETDTTCSYCSVGCSLKLESYGDMLIKANPTSRELLMQVWPAEKVNGDLTAPCWKTSWKNL